MDKNQITELAKRSYEKGYNEGFLDAVEILEKSIPQAISAIADGLTAAPKAKLEQINKYWEDNANEANEKRTDKAA